MPRLQTTESETAGPSTLTRALPQVTQDTQSEQVRTKIASLPAHVRVPFIALAQGAFGLSLAGYGVWVSWRDPGFSTALIGMATVLVLVGLLPALRRPTVEQDRRGEWYTLPFHVSQLFVGMGFLIIAVCQFFPALRATNAKSSHDMVEMVVFPSVAAVMYFAHALIKWPRQPSNR